jgi:hypothetical protein
MAAGRVCASAFGGSRKTARLYRTEAGAAQVARGKKILAFQSDKDRRRKSEQDPKKDSHKAGDEPAGKTRRRGPNDVGHALRAAYQQAVSEDIPPEMLDLLGKLG